MDEFEDRLARALKSSPGPDPLASSLTERIVQRARLQAARRRRALVSAGTAITAALALAVPVVVLHGGGGGGRVTVSAGPPAAAAGSHSSGPSTCSPSAAGTVRTVTVPVLVGQALSQATGIARAAGLHVVLVTAPSAAGTVIAQSPPAGSVVASGSTLALTVAASLSGSSSTPAGASTTAKGPSVTPAAGTAHCAALSSPTTVTTTAAPVASGGRPAGGCAPGGSAFELSLASSSGGQPSPVAAARYFALHNSAPFPVPPRGWVQTGQDANGATVVSGSVTLHAVEGPDRSWQVDGGHLCR